MSPIVLLIIFIVLVFVIFIIAREVFDNNALFSIGIGAIIASNIYNVGSYPIVIEPFTFGLDSVIYTLYIFCGLLTYIDYGKKDFNLFLYSSVGAVLLTAFFSFWGNFSQVGITDDIIWTVFSYINSVIGTLLAMWVMIWLYDYIRNKKRWNGFLCIALSLIVASIINSFIYFGLTFLYQGNLGDAFVSSLIGSYIGKGVATIVCLGCYYIGNLWVKYYFLLKDKSKNKKDNIDNANQSINDNANDNMNIDINNKNISGKIVSNADNNTNNDKKIS